MLKNFAILVTLGFCCALAEGGPPAIPHRIHIQARAHPKSSFLRRRALSPIDVPLSDFFLGTDLEWFGNITVGTPPQILSVIFDTGSPFLEITSDFSTFVDGNTTGIFSFATGGGVDPVIDNDYSLTVHRAADTIGLVNGFSAPDIEILLIINQTTKFDIDPYDGIQGLGASAQGLFAALISQSLPALFSMYLTPKAVGNAELILGGIDSTKFTGEPIFGDLPPAETELPPSVWLLNSPGILVNGHTTGFLNTSRQIIFDSGTSNVVFPTNTTEAIYALISPDIKPFPAEPGAYGIACDRIAYLPATLDFMFTSQNGTAFNFTIPTVELNVGPFASNTSHCQTLINALEGVQGVLGGSLLKHYYTIYDIGAKRIGFAPAKLDAPSASHYHPGHPNNVPGPHTPGHAIPTVIASPVH